MGDTPERTMLWAEFARLHNDYVLYWDRLRVALEEHNHVHPDIITGHESLELEDGAAVLFAGGHVWWVPAEKLPEVIRVSEEHWAFYLQKREQYLKAMKE